MPINLHRLLGCIKLDASLINSQLNLLTEYFTVICMMGDGVMPLAISLFLELFSRRESMIGRQLNLLLLQQHIKYLVGLINVEIIPFNILTDPRAYDRLLGFNPFSNANLLNMCNTASFFAYLLESVFMRLAVQVSRILARKTSL